MIREMQQDFAASHPGFGVDSHVTAYDAAWKLMEPQAARAFRLSEEPDRLRAAYGRNLFGQGCLLARRLIERGVSLAEVTLGAVPGASPVWDTHESNFDGARALCGVLDPAWSMLLDDLRARGLLESTLVVWMGEFGRTPAINNRGQYPGR